MSMSGIHNVGEALSSSGDVVHLRICKTLVSDPNILSVHVLHFPNQQYAKNLQILPEWGPVLLHKVRESRCVHSVVVADLTCVRCESTSMVPLCPNARQTEDLPSKDVFRLEGGQLSGDVTHRAVLDDVHLSTLRARHEGILTWRSDMFYHREVAHLPEKELIIVVFPVSPDAERHQAVKVHLFMEVHFQPLRNSYQKLDIRLLDTYIVGSLLF
mmetsp:Transcript_46862/g.109446  ORF Transcript_46862/g.109446 Transcript_46862/m.109446 type:complete len:214 (-) Transcript_46862:1471-2112(-)